MPKFQYVAKEDEGGTQEGVLDAADREAAASNLRERGWFPVTIEPVAQSPALGTRPRGVRLKDRNVFFRQLATLLGAGMPLLRALNVAHKQTPNLRMAAAIEALEGAVEDGASFAQALEAQPKSFPRVYSSLVHAGESGGHLEEAIWRVVKIGEQEEDLRSKAFTALVYPAFLLVMGSVAVFILVSFVFPRFAEVFEDFNATLPWPTRVTVAICSFMGDYWWAVAIGALAAVLALGAFRKTETGRLQWDRGMLSLPLIGELLRRYDMAKFARTLGALFDNGVPVLQSLEISGATLSSSVIRREVRDAVERVRDGQAISAALEAADQFPPLVVNMLAVGEEGGRLGEVTNRVADAYDVEVERAVKALTALFEPLLIVVMGIVIGFLVISMLLPMLTLSAQVR